MDHLHRTKEILRHLIGFPTVSTDSNLDLIAYAADLLNHVGAQVDIQTAPCGTKANLFATLGPQRDGGILLAGHSDVVPVEGQDWSSDPFTLTEREGRLYGRGTCDMKGFIAAVLAMAPDYATQVRNRPLHIALTYDEETGCFGAQHLARVLQDHQITPGIAIVGEPTSMKIIEGHKGCYEYCTRFRGLEGHGSLPDLGVNAVEMAVRYVSRLLQIKDQLRDMAPADSPFDPPWTSVNVGQMQGGVARNVIASEAQVDWEMRPVCEADADYVKTSLHDYAEQELLPMMRAVHPGASIQTEVVAEVGPLVPATPNEARAIVAALTGRNDAGQVAFGTEAGIYQALGTDVVVCGPGSIEQAHKADEYLSLDQLAACLSMLEGLKGRLSD